ncbi:MAG: hypothetical protein Ta2B_26840 [Termitinemataceae bacterium]|nr:MAG: hypothetical protein Ta2B_26840 [Termitinemataceae bacterium]
MKLIKRRKQEIQESSASSDIAFLLIIYFIVIAGFNVDKGLLMNLPAKDSTRIVEKSDLLRFYMDDNGSIYNGDVLKDKKQIETDILSAIRANPKTAVVLDVSPNVSWQNVVYFVEMSEKLKVETFSFKMKEENLENENALGHI